MKNIINKALKNLDTNIVIGMTPKEADMFLGENGWELGEVSTGYCCDDWSSVDYVCKYYPNVKLIMMWNGWTGQVELVATAIEEDE